jgi:hypothetical protein
VIKHGKWLSDAPDAPEAVTRDKALAPRQHFTAPEDRLSAASAWTTALVRA